jgi:excisionase family DNA binding protein
LATKTQTVPDVPELDQLMTYEEVARQLGCSRRNLERLVATGEFPPPVRLGRRAVRFRRSQVAEYLGQLKQAGAGR